MGVVLSDDDAPAFRLKYAQLTLNWPVPIMDPVQTRIHLVNKNVWFADNIPFFLRHLDDRCVMQINEFLEQNII